MKKNDKKNSNKDILIFIEIFSLFVLLVSITRIVFWNEYNNDNNKLKKESKKIVTEKKKEIDLNEFRNTNDEVVAYIKVKGTNIEYPIVKHSDNDFYLDHSLDKSYNDAGWVFVNYENTFDGNDRNISIFAHNRLDGSMFGTLKTTMTEEWQSNKDNFIIDFITMNGKEKYQVFATYRIQVEDYYIETNFGSDEEFGEFLNNLKSRSNYDYGIELNGSDHIITLSTCDVDNNFRIVLHAKKI